jgi:hypothetical protein
MAPPLAAAARATRDALDGALRSLTFGLTPLLVLSSACIGVIGSSSGGAPGAGAGPGAGASGGNAGTAVSTGTGLGPGATTGAGGTSVAACQTINPGRVTIHRLNAVEYDDTVRDLLGDTTQPGDGFPDDAGGANFDNNADVLATSPLLFQKLADAAEALATTALTAGSATRARIITCDATKVGDGACAQTVMRAFSRKAWRRPPTDAELARLVAFVPLARANGDGFDQGISLGVQAALLSPNFMFRAELDPDPTATAPRLLNDYEVAARLSYFLWSSLPDDTLAAAADAGQLRDAASLQAQAARMLADAKASALVSNMGGQWFGLYKLAGLSPDPTLFPSFDASLAAAMSQETTLFLGDFFTSGTLGFLDMLDAPWTYANARLAQHYGLPGVTGAAFQKVSLAGTTRAGLLTQAAMLATTSFPTRTSPVRRGDWVLANLLCSAPPPPPDNVPPLSASVVPPGSSQRTQLDAHVSQPACAACHQVIDPIGFGLEHFDAIGAWRDKEHTDGPDAVIDASGRLPDGTTFDGAIALGAALKGEKAAVSGCAVQKIFAYSLGRDPTPADGCQTAALVQGFTDANYNFRSLIMQMIASNAFRMRQPVAPGGV